MAGRSTSALVGVERRGVARKGGAAAAAVALAVVLVGCGSDDDEPVSAAASATTAPTAAATAPATSGSVDPYGGSAATTAPPAAGAATVTIDNFAFDPKTPTFKVGQTVTVVNNDSLPHTWTSSDGGFDTGTIQAGKSGTVTLSKAGTFGVVCTIHPSMTGTVTVQP
jgi:plastocyanin